MRSEQEITRAIARHADTVRRICLLHLKNASDTEDVFQEVFLKYALSTVAFDSEEHEKAWFIRVTVNCSKTSLRSFWKTKVCELGESFEDIQVEKEDLSYALNKLPKKYSLILHLFYYEDLSIKEIAKTLEIKEGNVGVLLQRARNKLKAILEKEDTL